MDKGKMAMSVEDFARQNCASLLRAREERRAAARAANSISLVKRAYKCKLCDQTFENAQALGGHVTHHAKITPNGDGQGDAKIHECKKCHARFPSAPALRGHQTKHIKPGHKRRRGGRKAQTATQHDKPVLPFDLNHKPVLPFDLNLPPPMD